jgi:hypothetical protein
LAPVEGEEERPEGRAREGPSEKEIRRARGSSDDVGGAADACLVAAHLVGRWSGDINA